MIFMALISTSGAAQLFDFSKPNPYKKVFVETDDFDASYLQQLEDSLNTIETDSLRFSVLNDLAYYWHTRNLITALNFTKKGLRLTAEKENSLWNGRFQITQAAILLRQEKLDSAQQVLESAAKKVKETDLAFLNTQLGYVFERRGKLSQAADHALISLRLGEKFKDNKAIGLAYSDLSNLFWKQGKYEKGLEYGLKSLTYFEISGMKDLDYDFTLYVVGNNYLSLHEYQKALEYYERAKAIGERYGFYNNLSDVYISLVDLYAFLKLYDKAEKAGENAIKYAYLLDNAFMLMRSYLSVGELQNRNGNYQAAINNLNRSISVATGDFGDDFYLSKDYGSLGKAYANNGQYKQAYEAFEKYDTLKSLVFNAEADQRISLLQTEFEVAQKESTIDIQEIKLKQQKTRQNLILLITGLLFLFLILLFISFRNNRKKNRLLSKQNKEKEFLLKEIHHRVKNNLEVVSSLLALQTVQNKDPNVVEAMQESQNRVFSMGIIHQRLYQGKNMASIEMKEYFQNLGSHILDSYGKTEKISILYKLEPVHLDVDTAVPLGLIENELLTNSLKYAFPNGKRGKITIDLKRQPDNRIKFIVMDNGIGKQEGIVKGTGFGTKLVNLLTLQLEGIMEIDITTGTKFSFEFKVKEAV